MAITGFRDLRVWQQGMDLVEEIYKVSNRFPVHEIYGLTAQIRRVAVSIPSNIAEGHSREHLKEYLNYLSVAQGSLAELQTQVEVAGRLKYLSLEQVSEINDLAVSLSRQIRALRNALRKRQ
jgi:four helix bundle protein